MHLTLQPGYTFRTPNFPHPITWEIRYISQGDVWADPAGTASEEGCCLPICKVEEVVEKDKQAQEQLDGKLDLYPHQLKAGDEFILKQGASREWYIIAKIAPMPDDWAQHSRDGNFYSEEEIANWVWIWLKDERETSEEEISFWSTHALCNVRMHGEIVFKGYDTEFDEITTAPDARIHRKKEDYDRYYMEDAVRAMIEHERLREQA